jgi:hypothetical protein
MGLLIASGQIPREEVLFDAAIYHLTISSANEFVGKMSASQAFPEVLLVMKGLDNPMKGLFISSASNNWDSKLNVSNDMAYSVPIPHVVIPSVGDSHLLG